MIAVSTHRPHVQDSEYGTNQVRAFKSWYPLFDKIFYLGNHEPELESKKTQFMKSRDFPLIHDLLRVACNVQTNFCAVLNADIVLSRQFRTVQELMTKNNVKAATSKRWSLDHDSWPLSDAEIRKATVRDSGLDIFIATPEVWRKALNKIPKAFRIGHIKWDTWMIGFLNHTLRGSMADFTDLRCVFHPVHSRKPSPYTADVDKINDAMMNRAGMPGRKLK